MAKSIKLKDNDGEVYPYPYYPIGSIYLSVLDINPSTFFGGTWEQIAKGRTLVGVDSSDNDFNTVKKTGGSKELQEHEHTKYLKWARAEYSYGYTDTIHYSSSPTGGGATVSSGKSGTGNSGNLQPYFTCYIWLKTD